MMSKERKIVVFSINGEEFATDIFQVERILGYTEPVKVPEAPSYVKGVIKYEGKIIPIIDVIKRFNLNETNTNSDKKIIVVKNADKKAGLIVDNVSEVTDINGDIIEDAPDIVKGITNKYVSGIVKLNERIIILINTENILSKDDINVLNSIMQ
ncbi:purine-binding chemotaxis protein CheW [Caloramator sp. E03]|nr:chemotaxis protein CheW [Caloramator sp. E03]QCX32386.1 purine-binding chemotaxis protein CheW [Caloramator sp. E03]